MLARSSDKLVIAVDWPMFLSVSDKTVIDWFAFGNSGKLNGFTDCGVMLGFMVYRM